MINSYRSLHRNHAQQLIVSVSKHYYVTKNNILKYQVKPFETTLTNLNESNKTNVIVMSIRDHWSGMFYAEISLGPNLPSLTDFLQRAWSPKDDFPFCGIPVLMSLPRTVESLYPSLPKAIENLGIKLFAVTSGFQGGIRDIKTIESHLAVCHGQSIEDAKSWLYKTCVFHAREKGRNEKNTKAEMWQLSDYELRFPPSGWAVANVEK
ncbi:MAG: hypothetical protein Q8L15_05795 [Methylobacter sp.]|nr:hypothetical protein [Methylobacter sp.]